MCPQMDDNIIFGGDIVEGGRDARCQRDLEEIMHHLDQSDLQELGLNH